MTPPDHRVTKNIRTVYEHRTRRYNMTSGARRAGVSPRSPDPRPDATHSFRRVRPLKTLRDVGFCIGALLLFLINSSAGSGVKTTRGRRSRFLSVANGRFSPRPRHGVSCPCAFRGGAGKNVFLEKKKKKTIKKSFLQKPAGVSTGVSPSGPPAATK